MKPQITWYRRVAGVYHAAVESSEHSWIRTGKVLCGRKIGTPGFTTGTNTPLSHLKTCKHCVKKLEGLQP